MLALNLNHRPQCVSQLPEMKQLILCKGDYLDFLSAPQPILAVSACGGGSGSDNSIRMPSGSCPGCNARTSGGEGADKRPSHATKQPTCRTFNQFDLAPSLAIPIYVCPVSSMKVKNISEQPRNRSVMGAVGCHWFGPQAIDDT